MTHYLADHPRVFFSDPKEPFFWSSDYTGLADQHALKNLDDYLQLFAAAQPHHRIVAEGSTNYLRSECAVESILKFNPEARFLVMLRNPVEVAQAFHMEQVFALNEDQQDFEAAWRLQDQRLRGSFIPPSCRAPQFLQYGAIGRYGEQVRRLLLQVPRRSVLFVRFDSFRSDTASAYRQVLSFLGLSDDGRTEFPVVNASHSHRSSHIAKAVLDPPKLLREPVWRLRAHLRRRRYPAVEAAKRFLRRPVRRAPLASAFNRELVEYFVSDIRELERLLEWDLTAWRDAEVA